jgi:hypothetical protein
MTFRVSCLCSYALPPSVNCGRQSLDAIDTGLLAGL